MSWLNAFFASPLVFLSSHSKFVIVANIIGDVPGILATISKTMNKR